MLNFWRAMGAVAFSMMLPDKVIEEETEGRRPMGRNRNKNRKRRRQKRLLAKAKHTMPWHNRSGGSNLDIYNHSQRRNNKCKKYPKYKEHLYATLFYTAGVKTDTTEGEQDVLAMG